MAVPLPSGSPPAGRSPTPVRLRQRIAAGVPVAVFLILQILSPDIPGGLRYRLDPWVRQAADAVAEKPGTAAKSDALHEWLHDRQRREQ